MPPKKQAGNKRVPRKKAAAEKEENDNSSQRSESSNSQSSSSSSLSSEAAGAKRKKVSSAKTIAEKITTIDALIEVIKEHTPKRFRTKFEEKQSDSNRMLRVLANYGAPAGTQLVMLRKGEYENFTLELCEYCKGKITSHLVIQAIQLHFQENKSVEAARKIFIEQEFEEHGIGVLFWVLKKWFQRVLSLTISRLPDEFIRAAASVDRALEDHLNTVQRLNDWLTSDVQAPIDARVKVVQIGINESVGHSVVPENWLEKEFANGEALHRAMDALEWRRDRPPVTYCATYTMGLVKQVAWRNLPTSVWQQRQQTETQWQKVKAVAVLGVDEKGLLVSNVSQCDSQSGGATQVLVQLFKKMNLQIDNQEEMKNCQYVNEPRELLLVVVQKDKIFEREPRFVRAKPPLTVGVLVSRLQKSVRRGRECPKTLHDSILQIAAAPSYVLPEQQFRRVSATRQLVWRSFITCVEDGCLLLAPNLLSLLDLG